MECIFCKIAAGEVPSDILYRDEEIVAFRDIEPVAPTHVLLIPRKHIASLTELSDQDLPMMARMVKVANDLARKEGISDRGYRLVMNSGKEGTQLVQHLHLHLIGGRQLSGKIG